MVTMFVINSSRLIMVVCFLVLLLQVSYANQNNQSAIKSTKPIEANPDAKRLYDDLLSNYNRLIRPVVNNTDTLVVWLGLKLTQLTEVNLRNQVITASIWIVQKWFDYKLTWDPAEYGGVEDIYVPSELIWLPDIVLYNNADGNFEVTLMTKAKLSFNGEINWVPPAIYKSYCEMNVLYFPFDEQTCLMRFGSWTYNGFQVDLKHIDEPDSDVAPVGIDLSEFVLSVEWDLLDVPAHRNEEYYPCCKEPYADITFSVVIRRKTLFYTVNLIIPLVGITFLTVLVFYLPSDSGEKVSLCSSILVSLTVFFLLLAEIIPPTSLAVPLLGKYLLFTMTLVTLSICVTVAVLNIHFRSPATHKMGRCFAKICLQIMPKLLLMKRPPYSPDDLYNHYYMMHQQQQQHQHSPLPAAAAGLLNRSSASRCCNNVPLLNVNNHCGAELNYYNKQMAGVTAKDDQRRLIYATVCRPPGSSGVDHKGSNGGIETDVIPKHLSANMVNALHGVQFIAHQIENADKDNEVIEDWKYVSMVLDRLFLCIFTITCVAGTCLIILQAPSLFDDRLPITTNRLPSTSGFGSSSFPYNNNINHTYSDSLPTAIPYIFNTN